jgi:hypothetical protein
LHLTATQLPIQFALPKSKEPSALAPENENVPENVPQKTSLKTSLRKRPSENVPQNVPQKTSLRKYPAKMVKPPIPPDLAFEINKEY